MRLDQYIAQKFELSRNRAAMLVKDGQVQVNGAISKSASYQVKESDIIEMLENDLSAYVSRSALKLKYFLEDHSEISINGKVCLDVGASTGGFTQVLLEKGASKVYAVDVGSNQLHETLQSDSRIISMENSDVRDLESFDESIDLVTVDVSFISLQKVLPSIVHIAPEASYILLFKPQFEVGRSNLTKSGVVKNEKITQKYLDDFLSWLEKQGPKVRACEITKLPGEQGNQEYLIWI